MRPQVKALIDLIIRDNWTYHTKGVVTEDAIAGVNHFRAPEGYPRICVYGAGIGDRNYISFESDEQTYVTRIFTLRAESEESDSSIRAHNKLAQYLFMHNA